MERAGELRLCACEHAKLAHGPRPLYYGSQEPERDHSCLACECPAYREGAWQGMRLLEREAYQRARAGRGLPPMRPNAF